MSRYEALNIAIQALALLVSFVVLVLLIWQLRLLNRQVKDAANQAKERHQESQKRETLAFIADTMIRFHELLDTVPSAEPALQKLVAKAIDRPRSSEYRLLRRYVNYLEDISAGVNVGAFDPEAVYHLIGTRIIRAWKFGEEWIRVEQRRDNNEELYGELEKCAGRMEKERNNYRGVTEANPMATFDQGVLPAQPRTPDPS
ncbi:MAG TPA: DUF4760 domain-containing protein [Jatrophihabitans sp.]|jgi:hypothetical protein|uniref:DUF4760 domain-containing protein n=1 Tax=Jatrophihabitans sp. TaxID=1932789 RepID=UPI002F0CAD2D